MPIISFGFNITISKLLLIISNIADFHVNFSFSVIVFCICISKILTIAKPDISSTNGASTLSNFCSFSFKIILSLGNKGIDIFKKLKQHSHEFIIPSYLNMFLIPRTRSIFSCISDTQVYTSNLWP